jgi:hypothetical protein
MNISDILLEIPADEDPEEVITYRIGTLHSFVDQNFVDPGYTGEHKTWFDEFMKISDIEERKDAIGHAINELHAKLMSLDTSKYD